MRKIDEQKKQAIEHTVLVIIKEEGIQGLSFGKIAKRARVSSGAPYVYFKDKTDMLSSLYLKAKNLFDQGIQYDIDQGKTLQEKIFFSVNHFARMAVDYPLEANLLNALRDNPKMISEEARIEGSSLAFPLVSMYEEAVKDNRFVSDNLELIYAQLFGPFIMLLVDRQAVGKFATIEELNEIIKMSVKGVLR
ncbi:TetR/AcrR family transcriptional regulator [Lentilactobacillus sp. SPB1-3]|uniref:TetR/AcrR family transcriptional regulator n=1 Tax=Lentilactobacillus terminaliae TaxID=3003483 RepID=A0ACD5DH27_9LACO|nr:TetR/AcrR family transcriptional regulator [Lentilactobacillus sp. SPB1-3]MCZ0977049.1 TetR/AcrR family transcriptional regulator [Lentilactobacillus sp. SPB1-3]